MEKIEKKINNLQADSVQVFASSRFRRWAIKIMGVLLSLIFILPLGLVFIYFGVEALAGEMFESIPWLVAILLIGFGGFWCSLAIYLVFRLLKRKR